MFRERFVTLQQSAIFTARRTPRKHRTGNFLVMILVRQAVAWLIVILLSLLLAEGAVRVYALFYPKMMVLDDTLGWRHARNKQKRFVNEFGESVLVRQDALGMRSTHEDEPDPAQPKVLMLGDSFTEGVHVHDEQLLSSVVERQLPVRVLNAGVGGYGTVQQLVYLEREGVDLAPDVVVVMFFGNDLSDNCLSFSPGFGPRPHASVEPGGGDAAITIVRDPDPAAFERYILPLPFSVTLNHYSYFYNAVNNRVYQQVRAARMRELMRSDMAGAADCSTPATLLHLLKEMRALLEPREIALRIFLIPTKEELAAGSSAVLEDIGARCAEAGLWCRSLLPEFLERPEPATLYFPDDIHWTAAGHEAAAAAIAASLRPLL